MRLLTLIFCLGFLGSCNPCEDVVCKNGSTKEDGSDCTCECDNWYTGDECTKRVTKKFEGQFKGSLTCTEAGTTDRSVRTFTIQQSNTTDNRIVFQRGFYANLTNDNNFTIPTQSYPSRGIESIEGSGNLRGGTLTLEYTLTETDSDRRRCDFEGTG